MRCFFGWRNGRTTEKTWLGEKRPGLDAAAIEEEVTAESVRIGFYWGNAASAEDTLSTFFVDDIESLSTISDCGHKASDEPHDDGHIVPSGGYPRSNGTDVELSSISSENSQDWQSKCSKRERASVASCSTRATPTASANLEEKLATTSTSSSAVGIASRLARKPTHHMVSSAFSVRDNRCESDSDDAFAISSRTIEASHSKLAAREIGHHGTTETVCAGFSTLDQHKRTRLSEGERCSPLQWSL